MFPTVIPGATVTLFWLATAVTVTWVNSVWSEPSLTFASNVGLAPVDKRTTWPVAIVPELLSTTKVDVASPAPVSVPFVFAVIAAVAFRMILLFASVPSESVPFNLKLRIEWLSPSTAAEVPSKFINLLPNAMKPLSFVAARPLNVSWFVPEPEWYWHMILSSDAISVPPTISKNRYALFVIVLLAVAVADVTVTASSKVTVISKSAASATAPAAKSTDNALAFVKVSDNPPIHTNTSGVAAVLSFPLAAVPDWSAQPAFTAIAFSLAPPAPTAFESSLRNLGLLSAVVLTPHKPIVFLLFIVFIYYYL